DQLQHAVHYTYHGTVRFVFAFVECTLTIEMPEELVCAVDKMYDHDPDVTYFCAMPQQLVVKDLHELYESMGLSSDTFDSSSGFTIHFLQDTFKKLPFTSVPFRPNYFSFLFVREAFGKYTIDDLNFTVEPGTVYFTNPGNYRIFEWHKIV